MQFQIDLGRLSSTSGDRMGFDPAQNSDKKKKVSILTYRKPYEILSEPPRNVVFFFKYDLGHKCLKFYFAFDLA